MTSDPTDLTRRAERVAAVVFCGLACFVAGCSAKHVIVLKYDDFGPPSLGGELIGVSWYQWDTHGYEEDDFECNIRVLVFDGISEEEVRSQYPSMVGVVDYRYVNRKDATAFLKQKIEECEEYNREAPHNAFEDVLKILRSTLRRIELRHGREPAERGTRATIEHRARSYRRNRDHESLKWLSEHFLMRGLPLAEVEALLGESYSAAGDGPDEDKANSSRRYDSDRDVPYGHVLVIHVVDGKVDNWEWASE